VPCLDLDRPPDRRPVRIATRTGIRKGNTTMRWFKKRSSDPETIRIAAHGMAEEHIFIDNMQCTGCGERCVHRHTHHFPCTWIAQCQACKKTYEIVSEASLIMTDEYKQTLNTGDTRSIGRYQKRVSHTHEPSNIIELPQWLDMAGFMLSQMDDFATRGEQASDGYTFAEFQAVQCLQEALKFYTAQEEFPPREAFFSEEAYASYLADTTPFSQQALRSILSRQRTLEDIEDDLDGIEDHHR